MPRHRCLAFLALSLALAPSLARAGDAPRIGRALWLSGESPGVWVSPRALWTPDTGAEVLSACAARRGCAPVVERRACALPECPGQGWLHVVSRDLALVGDLPRDYEGYTREIERLSADPSLSALHEHLQNHPERHARAEQREREEQARRREQHRHEESVRWASVHRAGERLELSLSGSLASLTETGGSYAGATATLSYTRLLPHDMADERSDDATVLGILLGDAIGGELRVHFLHRLDAAQEAQWITAVGIGPTLTNRFERSVARLPTYFGLLLPEFGAIFRADRAPTWYAAWAVPFSFLLTHDVAFDAAARLFVVDDWIPKLEGAEDDPAELIVMLSLGLRLP